MTPLEVFKVVEFSISPLTKQKERYQIKRWRSNNTKNNLKFLMKDERMKGET
tara:strand:+ start:225 stop:380 length:156 start_codon:yes stop_codon:yes gene_type:complete